MSEPTETVWFAWVPSVQGALAHAALKGAGRLHQAVQPLNDENRVGFPLTQVLSDFERGTLTNDGVHVLAIDQRTVLRRAAVDPHQRLAQAMNEWFEHHLGRSAIEVERPHKWERLGELVLVPEGSFTGHGWDDVRQHDRAEALWADVAEALGGRSLAVQAPIADDDFRSPQMTLLHGSSRVEFTAHGIAYRFDAARVMWSSGNVTERRRIGQLDLSGETVVDAYAGVGYYTLPMLVHGGAVHVHACEWNPASVEGLRASAALNGVGGRLTVHQGDNAETMAGLTGQADRVHLGLLPSSESAWQAAVRCLRDSGGWLHVHMNVEEERIEGWVERTVDQLNDLAAKDGRPFRFTAEHLERVKWFAPRVRHVVLDARARPLPDATRN
jgi:tRNA G37 N-methylase Trm5